MGVWLDPSIEVKRQEVEIRRNADGEAGFGDELSAQLGVKWRKQEGT